MVRSMEGIGTRLPGASGGKAWGIDAKNKTNVAQFSPPWTVTRDVWHDALRPDVSGVAVDALPFHEAGSRLVHRYCVYKDPFPHPALRDGVIPRLLSSVCRAMAIAQLTHLRLSIPLSGAPPGKVPESCYLEAESAVAQPLPPSCVIRGGRRYATHEGRFAGVILDKPTTDAAGGGGIGERYVVVGGGRNSDMCVTDQSTTDSAGGGGNRG